MLGSGHWLVAATAEAGSPPKHVTYTFSGSQLAAAGGDLTLQPDCVFD